MSIKIASPESVGICSSRLSRISEIMADEVKHGRCVGINTLISRAGKIVHFEQFGLMNRETQQKMQGDTLFRIYSMTKPIICTAFMTLYEQGKFSLLDPVAKFIPAFAQLKVLKTDAVSGEKLVDLEQPITIRHLLTHTAGLAYDFYEASSPVCRLYREHNLIGSADISLQEFVSRLCQLPLAFQPGTRWFYSVSIDVIAYLIEVIANKPLSQFLSETIFKPLEMNDTGFFVPDNHRDRVAAMYGGADIAGPNVSWTTLLDVWQRGINEPMDVSKTCPISNPKFARGGFGLVSTAEDFWRFTQMLLNKGKLNDRRILGHKTVEFMHLNHVNPALLPLKFENVEMPGYGFGLGSRVLLNVAESQLLGSQGEYGWSGAAKTYYWIDPKENLIGIFLTQSMCNFSMIELTFRTLTYQALEE